MIGGLNGSGRGIFSILPALEAGSNQF